VPLISFASAVMKSPVRMRMISLFFYSINKCTKSQCAIMLSRGYRSLRQLSHLIEPGKCFAGGHYLTFAVWSQEVAPAFNVV
jgi:hypothetical protein